ncbi:MAG: sodium:proline symporter [Verrucomicrobiaceae bacterium]|nr:MAG: sodium:proline symporter [Verrucomicrobiaceae bacterium]
MAEFGLDLVIIGVYFTVIIGIGLYASRGQKTMETYALGDRSMPWWAVLASILASEISAGTFLGTPGEGYAKRNFLYAQLVIGTILARLLVAAIFIKPFYRHNVTSIYEYLEIRFGLLTRRIASLVFLLTRSLASGSRIFIAAILLALAWEVANPEFLSFSREERFAQELFIYAGAVVIITALTALYTTFGGIKAVVWTDFIQISLMFGAAFYVFFWLLGKTGGWSAFGEAIMPPVAIDTGLRPGRDFGEHLKFILEQEYTIWAALLGSIFTTLATHGTDQDMVQRMLTSKDARRGQRAVILSGLVDLPVVIGFLAIGILVWKYYELHPANKPAGDPGIFAWFMVHDLAPGVRGLIAAGLFATAMGSLSTALNALATTFTKDWYVGVFRPDADSRQQMRAARAATVGFAVLLSIIGVGTAWVKLSHPDLRIIPIVLGSFGYTYGSLLGVFLVGMLTRTRGNCGGNVIGMICGFIAVALLTDLPNDVWAMLSGTPLYQNPDWLPVIAFTWRIMVGTLVTVCVALCFRSNPGKVPAA